MNINEEKIKNVFEKLEEALENMGNTNNNEGGVKFNISGDISNSNGVIDAHVEWKKSTPATPVIIKTTEEPIESPEESVDEIGGANCTTNNCCRRQDEDETTEEETDEEPDEEPVVYGYSNPNPILPHVTWRGPVPQSNGFPDDRFSLKFKSYINDTLEAVGVPEENVSVSVIRTGKSSIKANIFFHFRNYEEIRYENLIEIRVLGKSANISINSPHWSGVGTKDCPEYATVDSFVETFFNLMQENKYKVNSTYTHKAIINPFIASSMA